MITKAKIPEGGSRRIHLGEILQSEDGRWWQYVGKDEAGMLTFATRDDAAWAPGAPFPGVRNEAPAETPIPNEGA